MPRTNYAWKKYYAELDRRGGKSVKSWVMHSPLAIMCNFKDQICFGVAPLPYPPPQPPSLDTRRGAILRGMETHVLVEASLTLLR